ncbi:MAG: pyroglutamyl-peptidase I [Proteobacteria bacterium]|jgi:pyroglutamyl-peptidase|nr:pyroglutamyl-peptidase I [Pseudomonadota bacterium]
MKKILITGFAPFLGETVNPSQQLLKRYESSKYVETLLLPVSYGRAWELLQQQLQFAMNTQEYAAIIMLGLAGGRKQIGLERVAINFMDASHADEDGVFMTEKIILPEGPTAYLSPLPLRQMLQNLRAKGCPVEISNSAGTFICNLIYYRCFQFLAQNNFSTRLLFVHVPYMTEQVFGKSADTPALTFEVMDQTLGEIVCWFRNQELTSLVS